MRRATIGVGVGVLALVAAVSLVLIARQRRGDPFWTDASGAVRVRAQEQDPRRVLWQPPKPVLRPDAPNADEYEPRLSADGTLMVFVRGKPGQNAELFESRFVGGAWTQARPIAAINTDRDELGPELSSDGRTLYFYSDRAGGLGGFDLWVSRRTPTTPASDAEGEAWGEPVNLGPSVNSVENEYGVAIAPDGSMLYFSSNRPRAGDAAPATDAAWAATLRERRSRNDYDLYAIELARDANAVLASTAQKSGSDPSAPSATLPAAAHSLDALNTNADEGAPAVSPFGDFLYFASDRPAGHGGHDLYRAAIKERTLGAPENLGSTVNTASNELDPALSSDGFRLYFSSDRRDASVPQAPTPETSNSASAGTPAPTPYRLWWTASREVTRQWEARQGPGLAALLRELWPWLLLLLLGLALIAMLARMANDELWRRRLARMSLLAKCLLLSLLLHAAIAWMLALWQVGSKLGLSTRPSGGSVRVSLRSDTSGVGMGGAGRDAGAIAGQLRSASTRDPSEAIQSPAHEILRAAAASEALESSLASVDAGTAPALERSTLSLQSPQADPGVSAASPVRLSPGEALATQALSALPALAAAASLAGEQTPQTPIDPQGLPRQASAAPSPDLRAAGAAMPASPRGADTAGVLRVDGPAAAVQHAAAAPSELSQAAFLATRAETPAIPAPPASLAAAIEARGGTPARAVPMSARATVSPASPDVVSTPVAATARAGQELSRIAVTAPSNATSGAPVTPVALAASERAAPTNAGTGAAGVGAVLARSVSVPAPSPDARVEVPSTSAFELAGTGAEPVRAPVGTPSAAASPSLDAVAAMPAVRTADASPAGALRVASPVPQAALNAAAAAPPSLTVAGATGSTAVGAAARTPAALPTLAPASSHEAEASDSRGVTPVTSGTLSARAAVAVNTDAERSGRASLAATPAERASNVESASAAPLASISTPAVTAANSGVPSASTIPAIGSPAHAAVSGGLVGARTPAVPEAERLASVSADGGAESAEPARATATTSIASLNRASLSGVLASSDASTASGVVASDVSNRAAVGETSSSVAIQTAANAPSLSAAAPVALAVVPSANAGVRPASSLAQGASPRLPSTTREDAAATGESSATASNDVASAAGLLSARPVPSTLAAPTSIGADRNAAAFDAPTTQRTDRAATVKITGAPALGARESDAVAGTLARDAINPITASASANLLSPRLPAALAPEPDPPAVAIVAPTPPTPPIPVETFPQRDPELREEMLERGGGSVRTEKAVQASLAWLARMQEPNGRWSGRGFTARCDGCGGEAQIDADVAMTGLSLLCFLGAGHTHTEDGPYQDSVQRALDWLIAGQTRDGDLRRGETMYGQTVATVALCEALAMTKDPRLAVPARRAVDLVVRRAAPTRGAVSERDTSVIGWLIMSLQSARRAGIEVPQAPFDAARTWLDSVRVANEPGAYAYERGGAPSPAMTAEAMFVQQLLGRDRADPAMQSSADYLLRTPPRWKDGAPTYYWYYATLALFDHQGEAWTKWNEALVPELLESQRAVGDAMGSWDPQDQWSQLGGRIYQTAVCTLSLEVYYRYRPAGVRAGHQGASGVRDGTGPR